MRFLMGIAVILMLIGSVATPAAAGDRVYNPKKNDSNIDNCIYDMTRPWPFRKSGSSPARRSTPAPTRQAGDADGDGVSDKDDRCPNTPRGADVDSRGCPSDSDDDGVYDGIDRCPDSPRGVRVDRRGCGVDTDRDGVPDGIDQCDNTPRGAKVDSRGCAAQSDTEKELRESGMIRLSDVRFATGSAALSSDSHRTLNEVGEVLSKYPDLEIEVGGHTDSQGSASGNQSLSEKRAQSVMDYLLSKFSKLKTRNFSARGYGEDNPIASNATAAGRGENRRVEFKVLNPEALR